MSSITRAAPTAAVSATEAKEYCRVDTGDTSQDNIITELLDAGTRAVCNHGNIALVNQTITWVVDSDDMQFPIFLPVYPAASITSITLHDGKAGDSDTVVSSANYELVGSKIVSRGDGFSANQTSGAATIIYVAGYGAATSNVPEELRMAVLRWIADAFEYRVSQVPGVGNFREMPASVHEIMLRGGYLWQWH